MKQALVMIAVYVSVVQAGTITYTDRYDSMNIDEVLGNRRMLSAYVNCALDKGKCTSEGRELKTHITDALQTGCVKCTETQRQGMRRVIKHLIAYEGDSWKQLVDLYDPQRVYSNRYEKELRALE